MFRRRRTGRPQEPHADVGAVVVADDRAELERAASRVAAWKALNRIVAEAVIRQDAAEELLSDVRERRPLAELAPRGGALATRFLELRRALPQSDDPAIRRHVTVLEKVFDHHALMLSSSLDLLAVDWRSERMVERLEKIDGLGAPAQWLEALRAELVRSQAPAASAPGRVH